MDGFGDAVARLMVQANELITKADEGTPNQVKAIDNSDTCSVELLLDDGKRM